MNCREFENIANDLARAHQGLKMISAEARVAGLSHAEACERCAARLMDERALNAGLKSLAASDEGKIAPGNVEAALLGAFRARTPKPVASYPTARSRNWRPSAWPRLAWAVAAAILIAFGFIVYRSIQNEPRKDDVVITEKAPTPQPSVEREDQLRKVVEDTPEPELRRESRAPRHRRGSRPQLNRPFIRDSITAYANDSEYLSDFFPLNYGGAQTPMESGEVIRVQMPRSALARFGLPVNVERADVPVKADLLVGEDGLAQAIRFVR
ncbi:MAG: anti-sigma factor [Blastocatellales bacterium]